MKLKKLLLGGIPLTLMAATPLVVASCARIVTVIDKGEYIREFNAKKTFAAFTIDPSLSYGGPSSGSYDQQISDNLIKVHAINETKTTTRLNENTGLPEVVILEPSFAKKTLSLAKEVIITTKDNNQFIFDSDESEIKPKPDVDTDTSSPTYSKTTVYLSSSNQKSINSAFFIEKLRDAKSLQFTIRENVHYVDTLGNITKYTVQPKDFWYSWIRTNMLNTGYRNANGGNAAIEKFLKDKLMQTKSPFFTSQNSYGNSYLYAVYGIDAKKFFDENQFIRDVNVNGETKKAVSFDAIEGEETAFTDLYEKMIVWDKTFLPAPSQYIDEVAANKTNFKMTNYQGIDLTSDLANEYKTLLDNTTGLAKRMGIYWYGLTNYQTLYNGNFYAAPFDAKNNIESYPKNKHYWNKKWVDDPTTLQLIAEKYVADAVDEKIFGQRDFNNYKVGLVSSTGYSSLDIRNKTEIDLNPKKYGLRYAQPLNTNSNIMILPRTPFITGIDFPGEMTDEAAKEAYINNFYKFNDAYGKLIYGGTKRELADNKSSSLSYSSGLGLAFRSIIDAAINWDQFSSISSNGLRTSWIAKIAWGSSIGGKDQQDPSNPWKIPKDASNLINALSAYDVDGNKINFNDVLDGLGTEIDNQENSNYALKQISVEEKIKSVVYSKLKTELAKVIAKFDETYPEFRGQNFEYRYFYVFSNAPDTDINAMNVAINTMNSLNPRLKFSWHYLKPGTDSTQDKERPQFLRENANGITIAGWGYDYDAVGSGLDGLSWTVQLIPAMMEAYDTQNALFKKSFPMLYELAEKMVEDAQTKLTNISLPFQKMYKIDRHTIFSDITEALTHDVEEKNGIYYIKEYPKEITNKEGNKETIYESKEVENADDPRAWSAKFWLVTLQKYTNSDIMKVVKEVNDLLGVEFWAPSRDINISRDAYSPYLLNKAYVAPTIQGIDYNPYSDYKVLKGDK